MQYIVFDLEWNEWMTHRLARQNQIGFPLAGEIIEIGAVRMDARGRILDSYERLVRPVHITEMHPHVRRLTGIDSEMLATEKTFPVVMAEFDRWCGEDAVMLSWGTSDRQILAENLRLHNLPQRWLRPWYNAQQIFAAYCLERFEQYGLARACEFLSIPPLEDAHRAVHDAMATARICSYLPLAQAIREYNYHGTIGPLEFRPTVAYHYFDGYADKEEMWEDNRVAEVQTEQGAPLAMTNRERYRKNALVALARDAAGETYLVRWKMYQYRQRQETRYGVGREVYRAVPELVHWYRDIAARNRDRRMLHQARNNKNFRPRKKKR